MAGGRATQIAICGHEIKLGDWVRVHYTKGRQGWVNGKIVELWLDPLQARVSSGWCFHDEDEILELNTGETMNERVKYDDPVLYRPMTEEDGEAGRFVVELRNRYAFPQTKVKHDEQWPPREISVGVELARLVGDALAGDGWHHSRWYLEQLADVLDVPVNERKGIAP